MHLPLRCFQWFKDTKMKANHNTKGMQEYYDELFPVVQRY